MVGIRSILKMERPTVCEKARVSKHLKLLISRERQKSRRQITTATPWGFCRSSEHTASPSSLRPGYGSCPWLAREITSAILCEFYCLSYSILHNQQNTYGRTTRTLI